MQTGQRREGSYYAFASFFQKLATGAAIWAMGQAFATTGYLTPTSDHGGAGAAAGRGAGDPPLYRPGAGGAAAAGDPVRLALPDHA